MSRQALHAREHPSTNHVYRLWCEWCEAFALCVYLNRNRGGCQLYISYTSCRNRVDEFQDIQKCLHTYTWRNQFETLRKPSYYKRQLICKKSWTYQKANLSGFTEHLCKPSCFMWSAQGSPCHHRKNLAWNMFLFHRQVLIWIQKGDEITVHG